jgi:hypothetical protein
MRRRLEAELATTDSVNRELGAVCNRYFADPELRYRLNRLLGRRTRCRR